ncbi:alpha/beta hydrolase [Mammaliicoccus sciuri]|uniref:alpha/beta fold hydrolase n=1 Tax=Mammaliicoccus sciuri TaxID=1296 RepID=UPI00194F3580|nr:alpha/beta hydrolase [Mammaliicoccus sciuri]MCD8835974.1 alpha/beta hydrolase [Mammaliicoccus sciuri]MCJ0939053.1 alpha/beta hydrolase [Mammaliicoccus sciuri]MCJ0964219.1 alpha/beta hydrolase [Mammaliicoccus sciuri]MEB6226575.1 alpha/beta hydrolase [Mammaliicoccus sciuri]
MEEQILFLSGLGSHRLFLKDLNNQLDNLNLVQIDLPGHGLNLDVIVNDLNELVEWFKTEIKIYGNEELSIMGHSLGADLLSYISIKVPQIKNIILLDGGLFNLEDLEYSSEVEIKDTKNHLENFQFKNLDEFIETEKDAYKTWNQNLLEASTARLTFNQLIDRNIMVLLPQEQDQFILDMKIKNIPSHISCKTIPNSGHDIYIDNPVTVGKEIKSWLSTINE